MSFIDLKIIRPILAEAETIAIVGLSPKKDRPSNMVGRYLQAEGYTILPVNPGQKEILGRQCYPDLTAIKQPVAIITIFRKSDQVGPIVDAAITIGPRLIWMQEGVVNTTAAMTARQAGIAVVMDQCIKTVHQHLKPF